MRADLPPGLQAAQAVHAAFSFALRFPDTTRKWFVDSNFIVVVSVPDETALHRLSLEAMRQGICSAIVNEPDIGDQTTALALGPGVDAQKLCASLPLALRERAMA